MLIFGDGVNFQNRDFCVVLYYLILFLSCGSVTKCTFYSAMKLQQCVQHPDYVHFNGDWCPFCCLGIPRVCVSYVPQWLVVNAVFFLFLPCPVLPS